MDFLAVDIFIIFVILISFIIGWIRGATKEILSVISWFGSIYLAISIFPYAKEITRGFIEHGLIADFVTACVLFILFLTMLSVFNHICSNFIKKSLLNRADKAMGAFFGFIRGIVLLALLDMLVIGTFVQQPISSIENSKFRPHIHTISQFALVLMPESLQEKIISGMSISEKEKVINFISSEFSKSTTSIANENKAQTVAEIETPDSSPKTEPSKPDGQSAKDLSTLKPKKQSAPEKTRGSAKKEQFDMDRLLDQLDVNSEDE